MNINRYVEFLEEKVDEFDSCKELLTVIIEVIDRAETEQYAEYQKYAGVKDTTLSGQLLAEWSSVYRLKNKIHEIYEKQE